MVIGSRHIDLAALARVSRRPEQATTSPPEPGDRRFALFCFLAIFPLAAIAHHAVFRPTTCMLGTSGPDYSLAAISRWLSTDPSLLVAILLALGIHRLARLVPAIRDLVPVFVIAFLPLSVWIWDIPFTGRFICDHFHDLRVLLIDDVPLRSRHFYLLGGLVFTGELALRQLRSWRVRAADELVTT